MELILVRHGKPDRRNFDRPEGPPLADAGLIHARTVAPRVAAMKPDVLVSSHLARARQTAEATAALTGQEILTEPDISEVDGEGVPYIFVEDLRAQGGDVWREFLRNPIKVMGADPDTFCARVRAGFARIAETHAGADRVAVFTHGFPINLMVGDAVGSDLLAKLAPDYCGISRFRVLRSGRFQLLSFNDIGHFAAEAS